MRRIHDLKCELFFKRQEQIDVSGPEYNRPVMDREFKASCLSNESDLDSSPKSIFDPKSNFDPKSKLNSDLDSNPTSKPDSDPKSKLDPHSKYKNWSDDISTWPSEYLYDPADELYDPLERFRPVITSMDLSALPSDVLAYLLSWVDDAPIRQVCRRWRDAYPKRMHTAKRYAHRIELLQWAFDNNCPKNTAVSMAIVRFGGLRILKWAFGHGCFVNELVSIAAAEIGSLKTLKWMQSVARCVDISTVFVMAVRYVDLPIIKWTLSLGYKPDEDAVPAAVKAGHVPLVRWLVNRGCEWSGSILREAVITSDLDILEYLCGITECTEEQGFQCVAEAVNRNDMVVFDWLIAHGFKCDSRSYTIAAIRNNIPMLQRIYQEDVPWNTEVCAGAVKAGTAKSLETLRWLRHNDAPWDPITFAEAAYTGNIEILEWLRNNGCPWDERACAGAALGGKLDALKWLRDHGCPWDKRTCLEATYRGHLDVLKWAIEAGCPMSKRVVMQSVTSCRKHIYMYLRSIGWDRPANLTEFGEKLLLDRWSNSELEKEESLEDIADHVIYVGRLA